MGFDRLCVFSALLQGFIFIHLFYSYLIHPTVLFPQPLNTSWLPNQHRGAVCWPACTLPAEGLPPSYLQPKTQSADVVLFRAHNCCQRSSCKNWAGVIPTNLSDRSWFIYFSLLVIQIPRPALFLHDVSKCAAYTLAQSSNFILFSLSNSFIL